MKLDLDVQATLPLVDVSLAGAPGTEPARIELRLALAAGDATGSSCESGVSQVFTLRGDGDCTHRLAQR